MFWRSCRCSKRLLNPVRREYVIYAKGKVDYSLEFVYSAISCKTDDQSKTKR